MPITTARTLLCAFPFALACACAGAPGAEPTTPSDKAAAGGGGEDGARCRDSAPAVARASLDLHPGAEIIKVGQIASGLLVSDDPVPTRGGRFRTYQFEAAENANYVLTMRSDDFDAYLSVARVMGGLTDVIATDDDSGGNTDARLRFRPPGPGPYLIIAQALGQEPAGGVGAFTLELTEAPPPVEVPPEPIKIGQTVQGQLSETSMLLENEAHYHPYSFVGQAGQHVSISMTSGEFDAYLFLVALEGGEEKVIAFDDDSGNGTDARIRTKLPYSGQYLVRAAALPPRVGAFALTIEEYVYVPPPPPKPIRVGRTVQGQLTDSDPQIDDGSFYHDYAIKARAGQRLRITMASGAFDAFLFFGRMNGDEFQPIGMDDDSGGGTDAKLDVTVPEAGDYIVRANSNLARQTGAYTLRVENVR